MAEAAAREWDHLARALEPLSEHSAAVARRTAADIAPWLAAMLNPAPAAPTTPAEVRAARGAPPSRYWDRVLRRGLGVAP
jgi:hypothetical protein